MGKFFIKLTLFVLLFSSFFSTVSFAEKKLTGEQVKNKILEDIFADRELAPLEGFWTYGTYEIAIYQSISESGQVFYHGIIINPKRINGFNPGERKFWLEKTADEKIFTGGWRVRFQQGARYSKRWYSVTFAMHSPNVVYVMHSDGTRGNLIRREQVGQQKVKEIGSGTGFFITKQFIATNEHVVREGKIFEVILASGKSILAKVVAADPANDVAILELCTPVEIQPLKMGYSKNVVAGERVYTIGHPLGNTLSDSAKISEGIINSLAGVQNDRRMFQISIPIQPGNSGGPMFTSRGEVIGLTTAGWRDGTAENVNFAIKSDYLYLLAQSVPEIELSFESKQKELTAREIMQLYENAVVKIIAK